MTLRVTLVGTGTSAGVPMIGCRCPVCTSSDPRNQRLRCSLHLRTEDLSLVIDTPPDFRQQALRHDLERVDAVLFTHAHADHIYGLDDLRGFNFRQGGTIPCYGSAQTLAVLRQSFAYVFDGSSEEGGGKPRLDLLEVREPFTLADRHVEPVPVQHGRLEVFGYRFGSFAYVTDTNHIPNASRDRLRDLEVLILGALRYRPHPTHFHLEEAIEVARDLGARRTIFTHLSHEVDHAALRISLPPGMELGYDGLTFEIED